MTAANDLPDILETTQAERLATGFVFTEAVVELVASEAFRRCQPNEGDSP